VILPKGWSANTSSLGEVSTPVYHLDFGVRPNDLLTLHFDFHRTSPVRNVRHSMTGLHRATPCPGLTLHIKDSESCDCSWHDLWPISVPSNWFIEKNPSCTRKEGWTQQNSNQCPNSHIDTSYRSKAGTLICANLNMPSFTQSS
jgi:hypothetical protein